MPKITIIKIIHFTIDFLLAGFYFYIAFMSIYMTKVVRREQICLGSEHGSLHAACAAGLHLLAPATYHGCNNTPHLVILKYSK